MCASASRSRREELGDDRSARCVRAHVCARVVGRTATGYVCACARAYDTGQYSLHAHARDSVLKMKALPADLFWSMASTRGMCNSRALLTANLVGSPATFLSSTLSMLGQESCPRTSSDATHEEGLTQDGQTAQAPPAIGAFAQGLRRAQRVQRLLFELLPFLRSSWDLNRARQRQAARVSKPRTRGPRMAIECSIQ
jgi:hypothetical protein